MFVPKSNTTKVTCKQPRKIDSRLAGMFAELFSLKYLILFRISVLSTWRHKLQNSHYAPNLKFRAHFRNTKIMIEPNFPRHAIILISPVACANLTDHHYLRGNLDIQAWEKCVGVLNLGRFQIFLFHS